MFSSWIILSRPPYLHLLISILHISVHFYRAILDLHDLVKSYHFLQHSWLSSWCCNKNTVDWCLKQQTLFLTVLEAGKSKIKALAEWWDPASWLVSATFSLFSSRGWEQRGSKPPLMRAPTPWSNYLLKPHLQILSHWKLGFNIYILRGHKYSVHNDCY